MHACALHVDGADKAPIHLTGPAPRAPELPKDEEQLLREAGEESEENQESEDDCDAVAHTNDNHLYENVAEATVAIDPVHDVAPVRAM